MSKKERNELILDQLKRTTDKGLKSKKAARSILIAEGIYTPRGNLRKEFGGRGAARLDAGKAA